MESCCEQSLSYLHVQDGASYMQQLVKYMGWCDDDGRELCHAPIGTGGALFQHRKC